MKIINFYKHDKTVLSLEIFPPNMAYPLETVFNTVSELTVLNPQYISVTYPGGTNRARTVAIASTIRNRFGIESQAHLTCVNHSRQEINGILQDLVKADIHNIMALRGDISEEQPDIDIDRQEYRYAVELINDIKNCGNDFGITAAAHPEGHPECKYLRQDLLNLKNKVQAGVHLLITQLFFDNRIYYDFVEKARGVGINCPIIPGIMPVLNSKQIKRMMYLCGASMPAELLKVVDQYENQAGDMEKAGIEYASRQIMDLLDNKVPGVHLYTMNKSAQIIAIAQNAGLV